MGSKLLAPGFLLKFYLISSMFSFTFKDYVAGQWCTAAGYGIYLPLGKVQQGRLGESKTLRGTPVSFLILNESPVGPQRFPKDSQWSANAM